MKIKSVGLEDTRARNGIYEGAGGITRILVDEEGGSVQEEGPHVSGAKMEGASNLFSFGLLGSSES